MIPPVGPGAPPPTRTDLPAHGPVLAVLTPLAGGMYFGGILSGIAAAVAAIDGRAIAIQTQFAGHVNDTYAAPEFDQPLGWDHIDGFICVVNAVPARHLADIQRSGKPLVMVSNEIPGLPVVMPDNRTGIREAVLHLVQHGHIKIGFTGFLGQTDIRERYDAYRDALLESGITPDDSLYVEINDNDERGGRAAAAALLEAGMPATAIVAATDLNAIGLISGLTAAGRSLPRDLAVVGFDDAEAAAHVTPALSSVKQDFRAVGALAAGLVLDALDGKTLEPGRHEVTTSFVMRESCGCSGWRKAVAGSPVRRSRDTAVDDFARSLTEAIGDSRDPRAAGIAQRAVQQVSEMIDAAVDGHELPDIGDVRDSLRQLERLAPTPEMRATIIDGIRTFAHQRKRPGLDPVMAQRLDDAVIGAVWTLAQAQGAEAYDRQTELFDMLATQYEVGMQLLRGADGDASLLGWVERTNAGAGVLGLWSAGAGSPLRIAGRFIRDTPRAASTDELSPLTAFPPRDILAVRPDPGNMLFAVPVRSAVSNWGWFVTVSRIESVALTGWEAQNQWAALLTVALDEAEAAGRLKVLEREWHAILENTPDAIARYDTALRYQYLNAAAAESLGSEPAAIVGRTDAELGRDELVTSTWEAGLRQVLISGAPAQIEFSEGVDNDLRWFQARLVPQMDVAGMIVGVLASSRDLTAVKKAELALAHQAVHDPLTGLANRVLFVDRLTHSLTRLEREPNRLAVLFIDLDKFKETNDTLGHEVGDALLVEVAERLRVASRRVDTVARLGGDEFVILCDKLANDEDVRIIGDRVVRALAQPFTSHGRPVAVSASIGIVVASEPTTDAATLIRSADAAMYLAKERGGNRFQLFDPDLEGRATTRHVLEVDLRHAAVRNELRLAYQPLFALDGGEITGVEALLRWQHPERGLLMPADFMSIAEQRGLIVPIGAWVLDEACRQLAEWKAVPELAALTMSVNLSGRQLAAADIVETVRTTLARHNIDPRRVTLEITETTLIEEGIALRETLDAIVALGVHLALDDFGTGYSALAHLRDFPVDVLKIDRSFVEQLGEGGRAQQIVGALTAMAHFLGMTVVGEGIETPQQWAELRELHCDDGQGFLVSRAVPPAELVALLRAPRAAGPSSES